MKHTLTPILTILGALVVPPLVNASPVTPEQALERLGQSPRYRSIRGLNTPAKRLSRVATLADLYVFSNGDGFLIVPADDVASPLLAYADSGTFDPAGNPALQWWLSTYSAQIEDAKASGVTTGSTIMRASRKPIAPMIATRWNQGDPYNELCPELDGKRSVTGCVATAMAQVMNYHQYPAKGISSHSYTWTTGGETLDCDFAATTFDWADMTDEYDAESTSTQKTAVATLMKACGVSVDMDYSPTESSASSLAIGPALIDYFGYDKGIWMPQRQYYGLEEWEDLIYADLADGRPVLYCGVGSAGGHQFVCDGYSSDGFFHFNWGWGGLSDGYFQLTALDPPSLGIGGGAGGFNSNQSVVLGVQRPVEGSKSVPLVYCSGNFEAAVSEAYLGSAVRFTGGFYNYGCAPLAAGTLLSVELTAADGSVQYLTGMSLSAELPVGYGYAAIPVEIPSTLAEGTYTVRPAVKPAEGEWQTVPAPLSAVGELTATVSNGMITFAAADTPDLVISDLRMTSSLYWGSEFALEFTAKNQGEEEYFGTLVPVLLSADGASIVAEAGTYPVDLASGKSENEQYSGTFSASSEPEAGTYLLALFSTETGKAVSGAIEVTLNAAPEAVAVTVSDFSVVSVSVDEAVFTLTALCTEGYYAGPLTVAVFEPEGGRSVISASSEPVYIAAGQSATVSATVNVSGLAPGTYMAAVFKGSTEISGGVEFNVTDGHTSINGPVTDSGAEVIYDLSGRRVTNTGGRHGLYVVNSRLRAL